MRVFVTGGTGLIGSRLVDRLRERSDEAVVLSRGVDSARAKLGSGVEVVHGDPTEPGAWQSALETCDAVINLAGENIFARRWNAEFQQRIRDSRVRSTRHVVQAMQRSSRGRVLLNASAVGYYGPRGDEELDEQSPAGSDFLAEACAEWESAARALDAAQTRLVLVRIGVVLSREGGALTQMLPPFKLGVGGPVGSGRQWMAWVHIDDIVGIFLHMLDREDASGVVNGVAPHPVTNKEFSRALGRALGRPSFFPVPVFVLRLRFGKVAEVISTGQRVLPHRTMELGYRYQYPQVDEALSQLLAQG